MYNFILLYILICCSVQNPIDGYFELKANNYKTSGYLSGNSQGIDVYINHPHLSTNGWQRAEIELEEEQKYNHHLFVMKTNNNFMEMSNCRIAQMVETLID